MSPIPIGNQLHKQIGNVLFAEYSMMEVISDNNSTSLKDNLLQNGNQMMITELQGAESQGYICLVGH